VPQEAAVVSDNNTTGNLPGIHGQQPGRGMLGCVLVPVVLVFAFLALGTAMLAAAFALGDRGPFPGKMAGPAIGALVTLGLLALFFGTVARRLLASMRGQPVPHLFPPLVGVVAAGLLGVGALLAGGLSLASGHGSVSAGRGMVVGALFLFYAWRQGRALARARDGAADPAAPTT
jgi:hypothetical protein